MPELPKPQQPRPETPSAPRRFTPPYTPSGGHPIPIRIPLILAALLAAVVLAACGYTSGPIVVHHYDVHHVVVHHYVTHIHVYHYTLRRRGW